MLLRRIGLLMKVHELVMALERRAMDENKVVVVDLGLRKARPRGLIEVDGVENARDLIVLKLWKPPRSDG